MTGNRSWRRLRRKWRRYRGAALTAAITLGILGAAAIVVLNSGGQDSGAAYVPTPALTTQAPTPTASPTPASLRPAQDALAHGDVVLVLTDSTGHGIDRWVGRWARTLTETRTVDLWQWDAHVEHFAPEVTHLHGTGPALTVWNMAQPGAAADYPNYARLHMVTDTPDLIVYSYGHNDTVTDIAASLDATRARCAERWGEVPQVAILQNPTTGDLAGRDRDVTQVIRGMWAPRNHVATIDVEAAFLSDGRPLRELLVDGTHPSDAGSQLWARTVAAALGSR